MDIFVLNSPAFLWLIHIKKADVPFQPNDEMLMLEADTWLNQEIEFAANILYSDRNR